MSAETKKTPPFSEGTAVEKWQARNSHKIKNRMTGGVLVGLVNSVFADLNAPPIGLGSAPERQVLIGDGIGVYQQVVSERPHLNRRTTIIEIDGKDFEDVTLKIIQTLIGKNAQADRVVKTGLHMEPRSHRLINRKRYPSMSDVCKLILDEIAVSPI